MILFSPFVLICLTYFTYHHYLIHNIFEEIYYNQEYSLLTPPALETIDGVSNPAGNEIVNIFTFENYDDEHLPDSVTILNYTFNFSENYFVLGVRYDIGNGTGSCQTLNFDYKYNVKNRQLLRRVWTFDESGSTNNKEYVQKFLEKYGFSLEEGITLGDNIVKNVMLKDWCSVYYNTLYSPDDWGEVTQLRKFGTNYDMIGY